MIKKKSLGQNFLTSKPIAKSIALAGKPNLDETVVEIGPGEGFLTEELLKICNKIIVIEKDHRLIPILNEKFKDEVKSKKLHIIEGDILEINIEKLMTSDLDAIRGDNEDCDQAVQNSTVRGATRVIDKGERQIWSHYRIIANIPYYITGQIIRKFLETNTKPISMTLLLQKEVAERIIARDGKESLLSLSVKIFGEPSIIRTVGRGAFNPIPNVDSAVLNIEEISNKKLGEVNQDDFFKVIHAGFAHKRKQLLPNLSNVFNKDRVSQALIDLKINPKIRAEDVKLDDWIKITKKII